MVVHSHLKLFGKQNAAFDVFRVANGQIVEHWDVLQPNELDAKNLSGRGALDGEATITDLPKITSNKTLLERFNTDVFIGGKLDTMNSYYGGDTYLQHNTSGRDGVAGLRNILSGGAGFTLKIDRVARVVAEGNFVFAHAGGSVNGGAIVWGDLYRVQDGKITEHWDVIQPVPKESANTNGML